MLALWGCLTERGTPLSMGLYDIPSAVVSQGARMSLLPACGLHLAQLWLPISVQVFIGGQVCWCCSLSTALGGVFPCEWFCSCGTACGLLHRGKVPAACRPGLGGWQRVLVMIGVSVVLLMAHL